METDGKKIPLKKAPPVRRKQIFKSSWSGANVALEGAGAARAAEAAAAASSGRLRPPFPRSGFGSASGGGGDKAQPGSSEASKPAGPRRARPATGSGAGAILGGLGLSVFSLFSHETENEEQKEVTQEDTIIYLLKKAKVNIMKGELDEAERILHDAARLSRESDNKDAIIYTYDTMANLAFMRGEMEKAEKLFKAAMSFLLAGGMKEDHNAIIAMSLKLTSIYAAWNQHDQAQAGYQFCIQTLEEKIGKQKELPADVQPEDEKADTRLLLGMTLDSYARYLLANGQAATAQKMYERALQIATEVQGETHPQSVVLLSDLATALDAQGLYEEAYARGARASDLARQTDHPEAHIVLNNLAGILVHQEDYARAREVYKEALEKAEKTGDLFSIRHIQKEMAEMRKKQKQARTREQDGVEAGSP
ncbi:hypothetical protein JRQ81_008058 [Phrynocephalus forsythii]|uniref:Tetratricopeptide repeat protein 19, mitochondrial n=1 Tax=Phrynocephalus forsythii TaxID=171643 RepID=A0A9Q0XD42_9SAUR|nr:hypothetical protein JRQ81_008058 [Phrynocephalus forsythii]